MTTKRRRSGDAIAPTTGRKALPVSHPAADPEGGFGLVEALIALIILSVGLLAVAGIALSVSAQAQAGVTTTQQVLAGQQVLESTVRQGYAGTPVGTTQRSIKVGGYTYAVERTVTQTGPRSRSVRVEVAATARQPSQTLVTVLNAPRTPPTSAP